MGHARVTQAPSLTSHAPGVLSHQTLSLFSDVLLHRMGPGRADDIVQGDAGPDARRIGSR
jgi:CxxC motif-containing protein (DUF1111 family)